MVARARRGCEPPDARRPRLGRRAPTRRRSAGSTTSPTASPPTTAMAARAGRRRPSSCASTRRASTASSPACSATIDHERRPRLLLRRHPSRAPRARPRQPADDRGAGRRARARPARPRRCRARRWASRSTPRLGYSRRLPAAACTSGAGVSSLRRRARGGGRGAQRLRARFDEAEALVARAAPELQRILAQALEAGGWFARVARGRAAQGAGARRPGGAGARAARRCSPRRRGWG